MVFLFNICQRTNDSSLNSHNGLKLQSSINLVPTFFVFLAQTSFLNIGCFRDLNPFYLLQVITYLLQVIWCHMRSFESKNVKNLILKCFLAMFAIHTVNYIICLSFKVKRAGSHLLKILFKSFRAKDPTFLK